MAVRSGYLVICSCAAIFLALPQLAHADCSAEWFTVSGILIEPVPTDQVARQMYEMRRNQANAALSACTAVERERKREAKRIAEEARQQAVAAAANARVEPPVAPNTTMPTTPPAPTVEQLVLQIRDERLNKAVSRAVIDGRCSDAKFIALKHNRMDLADQAARLCEPSAADKRLGGAPPAPIDRDAWIIGADYPASALAESRQGRSVIAFEVSEAGFPENCTVAQSSGWSDLDAMACLAVTSRGLFVPPLDNNGRRTRVPSTQTVQWLPPR